MDSNKKLGTDFEKEVVEMLADDGWWVHFISPDNRGSQPFDIIAVRDGLAIVGDCKTSEDHIFRVDRLEWNQRFAFDRWLACGNDEPIIFVKYKDQIIKLPYTSLIQMGKVDLDVFCSR